MFKKVSLIIGIAVLNGCMIKAMDPMTKKLFKAARNGEVEKARQLLKEKANVEARDKKGQTPLVVAALKGHIKIVRLLLGNERECEPFSDES